MFVCSTHSNMRIKILTNDQEDRDNQQNPTNKNNTAEIFDVELRKFCILGQTLRHVDPSLVDVLQLSGLTDVQYCL